MQNLGYHFCQIFQNVTPILKPIVLFILNNICIFITIFFQYALLKNKKHINLLIKKCMSVQKTFSVYKIYIFVHHNLKKPCLQRLVNFSCQVLQLLPISNVSLDFFPNILNIVECHWWVIQFIGTCCRLWCSYQGGVFQICRLLF
jgi:hypothetical protein